MKATTCSSAARCSTSARCAAEMRPGATHKSGRCCAACCSLIACPGCQCAPVLWATHRPCLARAPPPLGCQQEEFEAGVTAMKAVSEREKHAKEAGEAAPGEGDGEEEEEKVGSWAAWSKGAGMRWRGRWRERQQGIALCWPPGVVLRRASRVHTVCTPAAGGGEGGGEG